MPQYDIPWPSLASSPWPMAVVNPQGVARSNYPGPMKGKIRWTAKVGEYGKNQSGMAIGPDQTIYMGLNSSRGGNGFIALNPDGQVRWTIPWIERNYFTGPVISADTTIFIGGAFFRALTAGGSEKWNRKGTIIFYDLRPLLGRDGTIYTKDGTDDIYAFAPNGQLKWHTFIENGYDNYTYLVASPDGSVIYTQGNIALAALNAQTGDILWSRPICSEIFEGGPAVDCQGNIYFKARDDSNKAYIYSITPSNELRWQTRQLGFCDGWGGITIDYNGYIYFCDASLTSLDYAGHIRWRADINNCIDVPLICSRDNHIYGQHDFQLWCYTSDGKSEYSVDITGLKFGRMSYAVLGDGILYLAVTTPWLIAIE